MSEICRLCTGAGSTFDAYQGAMQWWPCVACGGTGVRSQFGPPTIQLGRAQSRFCVPDRLHEIAVRIAEPKGKDK